MANQTQFKAHRLTPAELALLVVLVERMDLTHAAETLGVSKRVIANRAGAIGEKLGVERTAEAVEIWKEGRVAA